MLIFLPIITFVFISLMLFSTLVLVIKRFSAKALTIVFLAIVAEGIFFAFYTLIKFGGAFGPGIFLFFLSPFMAIVIFAVSMVVGSVLSRQLNKQSQSFYAMGAILLIFAQLSPMVGINGIGGYCDSQARKFGDKIVVAMKVYKNDTGVYPEDMDTLARRYWKGTTTHNCMNTFGVNSDQLIARFRIQKCSEHLSLVTDSMDSVNVVWYDLETGKWSRISFLDSSCY